MATDILKEFLVAIGFEINESSYKRQRDLITAVEKQLVSNDKAAKEREASEKSRVANQTLRAAEVASNLRMVGAAVAGFATLAVGALAAVTTAVKNGIGEFDRLAYISGRTGASVNNIKAIGYAFSQTGSSAEAAVHALESFAKARRANPGVDAMIRSYGVSTEGDGSKVLAESLDAITKRHPQYTSQQVAGILGVSPEEVDHWIRYRKEIAQFDKQYKDLQRTFGVNGGEMARASTSISRAIGEWSAVVEVLRDKLVSLFLPAIEAVTKALTELLHYLTDESNVAAFAAYFDKPIAAVKELARLLKVLYDQFVLLFEYVRNSPLGKIIGAVNPGFIRDRLLDAITPGSAQASEAPDSAPQEKPGVFRRGLNAIKRRLGIGGGDTTGTQARAPGAAGKYRPVYSLSDADLDQRVVNTIAGEVSTKNAEGVDAVINNMLNRVGSKGWGPSGNLLEVARAPGQYAGYRKASAEETEFVRSRIRAIASGGVSDNTNGSNSYRAESYYRGEGRNKTWAQTSKIGPNVGGNRYGFVPGARNGPYAPYAEPKPDKQGDAAPFKSTSGAMSPGSFNLNDYLRSQPMGSAANSTDNSRTVSQNNPVTVNVQGASDPQATGTAVARAMGQVNDMSLRNVQTAIR